MNNRSFSLTLSNTLEIHPKMGIPDSCNSFNSILPFTGLAKEAIKFSITLPLLGDVRQELEIVDVTV